MPAGSTTPVEVGQSYFELYHQIHKIVDRTMLCSGLSLARAKVLKRLADEGPMNQSRLAALLGFAPRSVTDAVDALQGEGLLTRTDDPQDRRAHILSLTPAGQQANDAAQKVRTSAMTEIFGGLTPAERAQLLALLDSIRTTLSAGDRS